MAASVPGVQVMTDADFALGVEAILLTEVRGHAAHRALDAWWTRYALERGGPVADATQKWMAAIRNDHLDLVPYPLGRRRWWQVWKPRMRVVLPAADESSEYDGWTCP